MRFFKSKAGKIILWIIVGILGLALGVGCFAWWYLKIHLLGKVTYIDSSVALTATISDDERYEIYYFS